MSGRIHQEVTDQESVANLEEALGRVQKSETDQQNEVNFNQDDASNVTDDDLAFQSQDDDDDDNEEDIKSSH